MSSMRKGLADYNSAPFKGFEEEGAKVIMAQTLSEAVLGVEDAAPCPLPSWILGWLTVTATRSANA
jgi:hypothetical protein